MIECLNSRFPSLVKKNKNGMMKTDEDQNVIRVLGGLKGWSEFRGMVSIVVESWRMVGMESEKW